MTKLVIVLLRLPFWIKLEVFLGIIFCEINLPPNLILIPERTEKILLDLLVLVKFCLIILGLLNPADLKKSLAILLNFVLILLENSPRVTAEIWLFKCVFFNLVRSNWIFVLYNLLKYLVGRSLVINNISWSLM